ncbi:MAG TPA: RNA polymerase sigma factor [Thermoanaerobaculia bacterium]|nr:RNA polymerase sigma factor [Thermoanaerobaculia bacterium]
MSKPELHLAPAPRELPEGIDDLLDAGYRYARSLTHDAARAEDLVQDASLAMLASGASWERSYFFATVRNRFIDGYRRGRKVLFLALERDDEFAVEPVDFSWEAADVLETGMLERALGTLRTEEREALFLAVVEGYTAEEIGRMTDRPRGTILSLLHRAKKKLRELLVGNDGVPR